jgi:hypothetical protein
MNVSPLTFDGIGVRKYIDWNILFMRVKVSVSHSGEEHRVFENRNDIREE